MLVELNYKGSNLSDYNLWHFCVVYLSNTMHTNRISNEQLIY